MTRRISKPSDDFGVGEAAEVAGFPSEVGQGEGADLGPLEANHLGADGEEHAADLSVLAF